MPSYPYFYELKGQMLNLALGLSHPVYAHASMILGGMGPVNPLRTDSAKIFASLYALFSGLVFIALMGIVLSPVVHRIMHKFHVDEKDVK